MYDIEESDLVLDIDESMEEKCSLSAVTSDTNSCVRRTFGIKGVTTNISLYMINLLNFKKADLSP